MENHVTHMPPYMRQPHHLAHVTLIRFQLINQIVLPKSGLLLKIHTEVSQLAEICSLADITLTWIQHHRHDFHQHGILDPAISLHYTCTYFVVPVVPRGSSCVNMAPSVTRKCNALWDKPVRAAEDIANEFHTVMLLHNLWWDCTMHNPGSTWVAKGGGQLAHGSCSHELSLSNNNMHMLVIVYSSRSMHVQNWSCYDYLNMVAFTEWPWMTNIK